MALMWAICSARLKIIVAVLPSCWTTPLRVSLSLTCCGSGTNCFGTTYGPIGVPVSKFLLTSQSEAKFGQSERTMMSRAEMSLTMV